MEQLEDSELFKKKEGELFSKTVFVSEIKSLFRENGFQAILATEAFLPKLSFEQFSQFGSKDAYDLLVKNAVIYFCEQCLAGSSLAKENGSDLSLLSVLHNDFDKYHLFLVFPLKREGEELEKNKKGLENKSKGFFSFIKRERAGDANGTVKKTDERAGGKAIEETDKEEKGIKRDKESGAEIAEAEEDNKENSNGKGKNFKKLLQITLKNIEEEFPMLEQKIIPL